jgi:hypothetical protein
LFFYRGNKENARCSQDTEEKQGYEHNPHNSVADAGFQPVDALSLDVGKDKGEKKEQEKRSQQVDHAKKYAPDHKSGDIRQNPIPGLG